MELYDLVGNALALPTDAIAYHVCQRLAAIFPDRAIVECGPEYFDIEAYARAGRCTLREKGEVHTQVVTSWEEDDGIEHRTCNGWLEVDWRGQTLDVLVMTWTRGFCEQRAGWILADETATAEAFLEDVCAWNAEIRDEVLVFDGGYWRKDEGLFRAIKGSTLDNLVLGGTLKQEIRDDLARFFAMRSTYEEHGIPWKRGILFVGPPGNGKTHAVKALVNALGHPCLYVKSFRSEHATDHDNIRAVFKRARRSAPCLLVLEDLDSLLDEGNRSFFLNELDGFAANVGIVTLATTNHPDRLDPAILDRPSRFDRKYPFELPMPAERRAFLQLWNESLRPALQLSEPGLSAIAEVTEGFSFAYLKELVLSSMMHWVAAAEAGAMDQVMADQVESLRSQMASPGSMPEGDPSPTDGIAPRMRPRPPRFR